MCFVEFLCLEFSLLFSYLTCHQIVKSSGNAYLYFLMILFIVIYHILNILVYLIYVATTSAIFNKSGKYNRYFCHLLRETNIILMHLLHVKIKVNGKFPNEKYLVVANHRSNFDPIIMMNISNEAFICVSKKETFKFPFVGNLIRAAGYLSLDRENNREAVKTLSKASDILTNNTAIVCIFPEGTRNKTDEPLLEMHAGSFKPALKAGKKTVVCSIKQSNKIKCHPSLKRQYVYVNVLDVLDSNDFDSTQDLKDKAYNLILKDLK